MVAQYSKNTARRAPFWSKLFSMFRLSKVTTFKRKFTYVSRIYSSFAPQRLRTGRFRLASQVGVPVIRWLCYPPELRTEPLPAPHVPVEDG